MENKNSGLFKDMTVVLLIEIIWMVQEITTK
jgi:hypothetical protein